MEARARFICIILVTLKSAIDILNKIIILLIVIQQAKHVDVPMISLGNLSTFYFHPLKPMVIKNCGRMVVIMKLFN